MVALDVLAEAAHARRRVSWRRFGDRIAFYGILLAVWESAVRLGWVRPFFFSSPSLIGRDLYRLVATGAIFPHLAITVYEAFAGLALGVILGIASGFIAALWTRLADALDPVIALLNSMPRVAIAPMFIVWFGFGPWSKITLVAVVVYFTVFFSTLGGMRSVDPVLLQSIRVMGASKMDTLRIVSMPFTMAWVFTAMKTCISLALIGAVVGEFVGSQAGLGFLMLQASGSLDTTRLFSVMMVLGLLGVFLFTALHRVENYVLRWRPRTEE
jgi:NitT/TauT family transport system permease protein